MERNEAINILKISLSIPETLTGATEEEFKEFKSNYKTLFEEIFEYPTIKNIMKGINYTDLYALSVATEKWNTQMGYIIGLYYRAKKTGKIDLWKKLIDSIYEDCPPDLTSFLSKKWTIWVCAKLYNTVFSFEELVEFVKKYQGYDLLICRWFLEYVKICNPDRFEKLSFNEKIYLCELILRSGYVKDNRFSRYFARHVLDIFDLTEDINKLNKKNIRHRISEYKKFMELTHGSA